MRKFSVKTRTLVLVVFLPLMFCVSPVFSDELEDRRIMISLSVFPKVVAVDKDLEDKLTDDDKVKFLLVYDSDWDKANTLSKQLMSKVTNLRGKKIEVALKEARDVSLIFPEKATAIFLTERLNDVQFDKIIRAGISEHITVFSPYAGDVERGATVGLAIGNRIKPYFNMKTLKASDVHINQRLLKISKRYE